jgi:hypothetical protein
MFTRFFLCSKNKKNNEITDLSITLDKDKDKNKDKDLDTSFHFLNMKDGIGNPMDIIKQKIEHYVALNTKELNYIKEMSREDLYNVVWLYNHNNAKY